MEFRHVARFGMTGREQAFELGPDALEMREGGARTRFAYREIGTVRLQRLRSRQQVIRSCLLRGRSGSVRVRAVHGRTLFDDERPSETYAPFVRELSRRIAAANPNARFVTGIGPGAIAGMTALIVAVAAAFMGLLGQLGTQAGLIIVGGSALMVPLIALALGQGFERRFDPSYPPEALLGG